MIYVGSDAIFSLRVEAIALMFSRFGYCAVLRKVAVESQ